VLAIAAAKLLHRPVLATDIDPRAARVAATNARLNQAGALIRAIKADGWMDKRIKRAAPFDLVFANILARPLCAMAFDLARNMKPGGIAILAGLLTVQANWVLSAHRRAGLVLTDRIIDGAWTILILHKR
jgi:ribosomal protein L11 methyltransferase